MEMTSVYEKVRAKIVGNELPPGSKINIDALVRELGVSQTPVRETLHHLEGDGLVERTHGRGYSTTKLLTDVEFKHMFEVRLLLEPWSARVVASDRMLNPGPDMIELIDQFREHSPVTRNDLARHDEAFHLMLHRATSNRFLLCAFTSLHAQLHLFRLFDNDIEESGVIEEYAHVTTAEHREIATAILNCDPELADVLMRRHLLNSFRRFDPNRDKNGHVYSSLGTVPQARIVEP